MQIKLALLIFGAFFIIKIASQEKVYTQQKCDFANFPILQLLSINRPVKSKICETSTLSTSTTTLPTTTTTTTTACTSEASPLVKLHRLYNAQVDDRFFTPNTTHVTTNSPPFVEETSPGLVATTASDCLCGTSFKKVFRLYRPMYDNLYTASQTDVNNATSMGYVDEGSPFYCADQNICGATLPLHSYQRGTDNFLTTDQTADAPLINAAPYQGILCYIWPGV